MALVERGGGGDDPMDGGDTSWVDEGATRALYPKAKRARLSRNVLDILLGEDLASLIAPHYYGKPIDTSQLQVFAPEWFTFLNSDGEYSLITPRYDFDYLYPDVDLLSMREQLGLAPYSDEHHTWRQQQGLLPNHGYTSVFSDRNYYESAFFDQMGVQGEILYPAEGRSDDIYASRYENEQPWYTDRWHDTFFQSRRVRPIDPYSDYIRGGGRPDRGFQPSELCTIM